MAQNEVTRRVCLITGGSSGIGLATALAFANEGACVGICGRDSKRLAAASAKIAAHASDPNSVWSKQVDVGLAGSVAAFVDEGKIRWGSVDVLFNNAGYPPRDDVEKITRDQFDQAIAVNVAATFEGVQSAWPLMKSAGKGVIVNMSSMAAVDPFPGFSVYGACKSWVEVFSSAIYDEAQEAGIRVACIRPGAVETPMLRGLFPDFPNEDLVTADEVAAEVMRACDWTVPIGKEPIAIVRKS